MRSSSKSLVRSVGRRLTYLCRKFCTSIFLTTAGFRSGLSYTWVIMVINFWHLAFKSQHSCGWLELLLFSNACAYTESFFPFRACKVTCNRRQASCSSSKVIGHI